MSKFTSPLELEYLDGKNYRITVEFDYILDWQAKDDRIIRVPANFVTDFASIPRILWNLLPPTGKYGKAAVIHDYLYRNGGKVPCPNCEGDTYSRSDCDKILYDAMGVLGVGRFTRWIIYSGVRIGGWASFKG